MMAGSDTLKGSASALTERFGASASRANKARRVGSASAAKVRSSGVLLYLTMWLRIGRRRALSSARGQTWLGALTSLELTWTHLGPSPHFRDHQFPDTSS
jgi:hypothetical protein